MTHAPRPRGTQVAGRRAPRRAPLRKWLLGLAALGIVFAAGLALGQALEDAPQPGGSVTYVRTLHPSTLPPATQTVTVTTSNG